MQPSGPPRDGEYSATGIPVQGRIDVVEKDWNCAVHVPRPHTPFVDRGKDLPSPRLRELLRTPYL